MLRFNKLHFNKYHTLINEVYQESKYSGGGKDALNHPKKTDAPQADDTTAAEEEVNGQPPNQEEGEAGDGEGEEGEEEEGEEGGEEEQQEEEEEEGRGQHFILISYHRVYFAFDDCYLYLQYSSRHSKSRY